MATTRPTVLVTGGGGYVGAVLVPKLMAKGYRVRVIDLFLFGTDVLPRDPSLELVKADIRDQKALGKAAAGVDAVIHLACISNDPSFELNPELSRSINYDCFEPLVASPARRRRARFIYASTRARSTASATRRRSPRTIRSCRSPTTTSTRACASRSCSGYQAPDFTTVIIRPATVCGYSPRHAARSDRQHPHQPRGESAAITVFGGSAEAPQHPHRRHRRALRRAARRARPS